MPQEREPELASLGVREEKAEGCISLLALGGAALSASLASAGELAERTMFPGVDFPGGVFIAIAGGLAVGSFVMFRIGKAWDRLEDSRKN